MADVWARDDVTLEGAVAEGPGHREDAPDPPRARPDHHSPLSLDALALALLVGLVVLCQRNHCMCRVM